MADKLTSMEKHFERHLSLHKKLAAAKGQSTSAAIADMRENIMSDGKIRTRRNSQVILAGFRQEMKKARGE